MTGEMEHYAETAATLGNRYKARLKSNPKDADAYHHRAHALTDLKRFKDTLDDWTHAIGLRPDDAQFRAALGRLHVVGLRQDEAAIADLEVALALDPNEPQIREPLTDSYNYRVWEMTVAPAPKRDFRAAMRPAKRALDVTAGQGASLTTLGVVQYRGGRYAEAAATFGKSLIANLGQSVASDLFFLATSHHRLGHHKDAMSCFERAVNWIHDLKNLSPPDTQGLAALRAEAEAVLVGRTGQLPDDFFARSR